MHYRRGVDTIHDMIWQKLLRAQSLLESQGPANFESLEDTYKDLINYASFAVSFIRGKMEGQDPNRDMFNRKLFKKSEYGSHNPPPVPTDEANTGDWMGTKRDTTVSDFIRRGGSIPEGPAPLVDWSALQGFYTPPRPPADTDYDPEDWGSVKSISVGEGITIADGDFTGNIVFSDSFKRDIQAYVDTFDKMPPKDDIKKAVEDKIIGIVKPGDDSFVKDTKKGMVNVYVERPDGRLGIKAVPKDTPIPAAISNVVAAAVESISKTSLIGGPGLKPLTEETVIAPHIQDAVNVLSGDFTVVTKNIKPFLPIERLEDIPKIGVDTEPLMNEKRQRELLALKKAQDAKDALKALKEEWANKKPSDPVDPYHPGLIMEVRERIPLEALDGPIYDEEETAGC